MIVDIEFVANSNLGQLNTQINAINTSLATMRQRLEGIDQKKLHQPLKTFSDQLVASQQFTSQIHTIEAAEARWGKALNDNRMNLGQYGRALRGHLGDMRRTVNERQGMIAKLAKQQVQIQNSFGVRVGTTDGGKAIVRSFTQTGIAGQEQMAQVARKQNEIVNKVLQNASTKVIDYGKNIQWAGRQIMVGLTIPITLFGTAAARTFYDVDKQLTRLVKVYGDLGTALNPAQVQELRAEIQGLAKDLAQEYGQSMETTIGLAADFAATGAQGVDLMNSTSAATRLAVLGEVDRQEAMKTTLSLSTAFRIESGKLADAVNFLNAVENQTSLSLEDISIAIPKAGTVVKGLGGDFRDLALYMTAMKEGGVVAGEAANAIKSGLVSIINPSRNATKFLEQFGIDLPQIVKDNAGDLTGTILAVKDALEQLGDLERQQALSKIFGKYQVARMTALFNNLYSQNSQTQRIKELIEADAAELAGIADRELAAIANSASGQWDRALQTLRTNLAVVGEEFLKIGTWFLQLANNVMEWFNSLDDGVKTFLVWGTLIAALVGPVVMVGGVLLNFLGTIAKFITFLKIARDRAFGWAGAFEYLTPEIFAADRLTDQLTGGQYEQAKATQTLTVAIEGLSASYRELVAEQARLDVTTGMTQAEMRSVSALTASRTGVSAMPRVEAGHLLPREYQRQLFQSLGAKDITLRGGLSMVAESYESNRDPARKNLMGSIYTQGPNFKYMDPNTAISSAAGNEAWELLMQQQGVERKRMTAELKKAMALAQQDISAGQAHLIRALGVQNGAMFKKFYGDAQKRIALEVARVGSLTDNQVRGEIHSSLKALGLRGQDLYRAYAKLMDDVERGVIDARTALVTMTTAIKSEEVLAVGRGTGREGQFAGRPLVAGKSGMEKEGFAGHGVATLFFGSGRTADMPVPQSQQGGVGPGTLLIADRNGRVVEERRLQDRQADNVEQKGRIVSAEEKIEGRQEKVLKQRGRRLGMGGASGLAALSMIPAFMPTGDNEAMNTGMNVLSGVGMGASFGMMAGPGGALIGAIAGGALAAMPAVAGLIGAMGDLKEATEAAFTAGEVAASNYGATLKELSEIKIWPDGVKPQDKTEIEKLVEQYKSAPEDSEDRKFIDLLAGEENQNSLTGFVRDRATTLALSGVKPADIQKQVQAMLIAAGKEQYYMPINLTIKDEKGYTARGAVQDQVDDLASRLNPQGSPEDFAAVENFTEWFASLNTGLTLLDALNYKIPGVEERFNQLTDSQRSLIDETGALKNVTAELSDEWDPLVDNLSRAAISMPIDSFMKLSGALDLTGLSAEQFNWSMQNSQNVPDQVKEGIQRLTDAGWSSAEMLRAIALLNAGVVTSWQQVYGLNPKTLDLTYRIFTVQQNIVQTVGSSVSQSLRQKATDVESSAQSGGGPGGGSGGGGGGNDGRRDALNNKKEEVKDFYDTEIQKIKDAEQAKKEAAEAEKRRIERQKRDLNSLIDYREALAAGDFAAAAKIKNQMEADKKQDKLEDDQRKQESATDKRIKALEKERDKKLEAIDDQIEALGNLSGAAASSASAQTKAMTEAQKKMRDGYIALANEVDALLAAPEVGFAATMARIVQIAKDSGIDVGEAVQASLKDIKWAKGFETTGDTIFSVIKADIANAPWGLVGQVVQAAMAGNRNLLNRRLATLIATVNRGTTAGAVAGKATYIDQQLGASTGGHIVGPGTPTSDSIAAWLSDGEYVIKAASVAKYGVPFFHMLNAGKFASGGYIEGAAAIGKNAWSNAFTTALAYSNGGYARSRNFMAGGPVASSDRSGTIVNIPITVIDPGCSAEEVAQVVVRKFKEQDRRVGYRK